VCIYTDEQSSHILSTLSALSCKSECAAACEALFYNSAVELLLAVFKITDNLCLVLINTSNLLLFLHELLFGNGKISNTGTAVERAFREAWSRLTSMEHVQMSKIWVLFFDNLLDASHTSVNHVLHSTRGRPVDDGKPWSRCTSLLWSADVLFGFPSDFPSLYAICVFFCLLRHILPMHSHIFPSDILNKLFWRLLRVELYRCCFMGSNNSLPPMLRSSPCDCPYCLPRKRILRRRRLLITSRRPRWNF
jgi:hypothetical protein